jgi:hypothetical protein
MADRTCLSVIIYDCPTHRVNAVLDVLEQHGVDPEWGMGTAGVSGSSLDRLQLCTVYGEHEAIGDESEDVARELQQVAPEVSFLTWTDPKYEWLGSLVAYAPDLGEFTADCDADGRPQFDPTHIQFLLEEHRDRTVAQFLDEVHPRVTGAAWFTRFAALMDRHKNVVIERTPEEE